MNTVQYHLQLQQINTTAHKWFASKKALCQSSTWQNTNQTTAYKRFASTTKKHYACHPLSRTQIKLLHTNGLPQQQKKHYASHPLGRTLQVSLRWCNDVHTALDPREVSVCRCCLVRPVQPQYVTQSTLDFVYSQQFPSQEITEAEAILIFNQLKENVPQQKAQHTQHFCSTFMTFFPHSCPYPWKMTRKLHSTEKIHRLAYIYTYISICRKAIKRTINKQTKTGNINILVFQEGGS